MKVLSLLLLLWVHQGCSEASGPQDVPALEDVRKSSDHSERTADVPPEVHRLWDELSGLKELVLSLKAAEVEQRRGLESHLRDWQEESEQQRRRLDQLEDMLLHQPEELLTKPDTSLRRRVENLEKQSQGGSVKHGCFQISLICTTDGH